MRSNRLRHQAMRLGAIAGLFVMLLTTVAGAGGSSAAPPHPVPAAHLAGRPFLPLPVGPDNRPASGANNAAPQGLLSWTPTGGPTFHGGHVDALAVHPAISGTLYTAVQAALTSGWGTPATIYQSTDGAASWTAVYTIPNGVRSLATTGTRVYVGAWNGDDGSPHPVIYCSTDSGLNWTAPLSFSNGTIWTVGVHPALPNVAAAGGGDYPDTASLYRTVNAGITWTEVFSYSLPGASPTVNAVLIHPTDPLNWLLAHDGDVGGTGGSYILQSPDGGTTWARVFTLTGDIVSALVANPVTPTIIYAGTYQNNLYRSTDSGATWAAAVTDGSAGWQLAVEPPATLYANHQDRVRRSTDGGATWSDTSLQGDLRALAIDLGPAPAAVYAGLGVRAVLKSTDGGANWEPRINGIVSRLQPRDMDIDPADPTHIFAAADCVGSYRTTDAGATWTPFENLPGCVGAFAINVRDPNEVYVGAYNCGGGTIFRSTDGGDNFTPVFTPTYVITDCSGGGENIFALGAAPSLSSTVYAVGVDYPNSPGYAVAVRSLDHGASWTVALTLSAPSEAVVGAIDPQDDATAYVGGMNCSVNPCQGFIYRTYDHGDSWDLVLTGTAEVRSIVVDYQKPEVLYAATDNYRVYKSTDSGDTWTVVHLAPWEPGGTSSGNHLAIDPHVPSHIYLGGWGYVTESSDGGATWSDWGPINQGTPQTELACLRVDRETVTQTLYAGFDGAWSYSRPAPQPGEAVTIDMGTVPPSGTVYANCAEALFYRGLVLDADENWVADGTPITVTYDMRELGEGEWTTVRHTANGLVRGGAFSCVTGTITFTAVANVTATAFVTGTFLYNPPSGITITGAPVSLTVEGATGVITASVPGLHGGSASNGTVVTWETSLGTIFTTTLTVSGVATTTLTSGGLAGTAVITATAAGFSDTRAVEFVGGGYRIYLPVVFRQ